MSDSALRQHDRNCWSLLPDFDYRDCSCSGKPTTTNSPSIDLPTARLRQLRDSPPEVSTGRARTARINRLQADIIAADEFVVELGRYRILALKLVVRPDVRDLVDLQVRRMVRQTVAERDRLTVELRALQTARTTK